MSAVGEFLIYALVFIGFAIFFFLSWLASELVVQDNKKNIFTKYLERDSTLGLGDPIGIIQKVDRLSSTDVSKKAKYEYSKIATVIWIIWGAWMSCSLKAAIGCVIGVVIMIVVALIKLFGVMTGAF